MNGVLGGLSREVLKPRGRELCSRITGATDRETPRAFWMLRLGALYLLVAGAGAAAGEARTQGRCRVAVEGRVAGAGEAELRQGLEAGAE